VGHLTIPNSKASVDIIVNLYNISKPIYYWFLKIFSLKTFFQDLSLISFQYGTLLYMLTANDAALVHKNVASKNHNIWYEARLVGLQGERLSKPKNVFCYVSPKQLTVKEFLLKFIPKRLVTFRLCLSTKVSA
jgi:hypothetical protein